MGYAQDYANNFAQIVQHRGNAQAQAQLQSGAGWAQGLGQIGQTLAQMPQQMQQQRIAEQEQQIRQTQLDAGKAKQAEGMFLANAYRSALTPDGQVDRQKLTATLNASPYAQAVPDILKSLDEADAANLQVKNAKTAAEQAELGYAKFLGQQMIAAQFNPDIVNGVLEMAKTQGHDVKQFQALYQKSPEQFQSFVTRLVTPEKPAEEYTLNPGDARFKGSQQIAALPAAEKPKAFQSKDMLVGGRKSTVNFDPATGNYFAPGSDTPLSDVRPMPAERANTYDWAHNPQTGKLEYMTPDEIRAKGATKPPTQAEMMDSRKFEKAAPVISAINELSEKINTGKGVMATLKGKEEKAKAQINLNDDVAEYESLVEGFTPLVARSLGHTGVLTQQDVDSVKRLFPRPEDSKTLRDRKVERIRSIIQDLQGVSGPSTAPKVEEWIPDPKHPGKFVKKGGG